MAITHRSQWLAVLDRVARPVLSALADGKLCETMRVETHDNRSENLPTSTYLEALGRLLTGIAPWLECDTGDSAERELRLEFRDLTTRALAVGYDPDSPDYLIRHVNGQILVDTAFLAHGFLRAPTQLWRNLPARTQQLLINGLEASRMIRPGANNWLLFSAMVEAALHRMGRWADPMRVDYAVRQHLQWYKGDGMYGDGPDFHFDYYNSYVIHPMLRQVAAVFSESFPEQDLRHIESRSVRYAAIQERMIMPDGSFPSVGRSICYRGGAFHLLADAALRRALPPEVQPSQVRCGLSAILERTLDDRAFRPDGFLTIGLVGSQRRLAEPYISTGSLYLCATIFLPLGLGPQDPFWSDPDTDWTQKQIWQGTNLPADHCYHE